MSQMSARFLIVLLTAVLLWGCAAPVKKDSEQTADSILTAADNTFQFMKSRNHEAVWSSLTKGSQKAIIDDVMKACSGLKMECERNDLTSDFERGGVNARAYWDHYLLTFNPDMILKDSKWSIGKIRENEAEIVIQYVKSEKPAILKMLKEDGSWKTAMDESFGTRKWFLK